MATNQEKLDWINKNADAARQHAYDALQEASGARKVGQQALVEAAGAKSYSLQGLAILKEIGKRNGLSQEDLDAIAATVREELAEAVVSVDVTVNDGKGA